MRTVLNGRGQPVVLTRENCTCDGYTWRERANAGMWVWEEFDWSAAEFLDQSFLGIIGEFDDAHLRVPHKDGETAHRIRGKRWKITGLLPMEDRQP
jgi:hypothetical protein